LRLELDEFEYNKDEISELFKKVKPIKLTTAKFFFFQRDNRRKNQGIPSFYDFFNAQSLQTLCLYFGPFYFEPTDFSSLCTVIQKNKELTSLYVVFSNVTGIKINEDFLKSLGEAIVSLPALTDLTLGFQETLIQGSEYLYKILEKANKLKNFRYAIGYSNNNTNRSRVSLPFFRAKSK